MRFKTTEQYVTVLRALTRGYIDDLGMAEEAYRAFMAEGRRMGGLYYFRTDATGRLYNKRRIMRDDLIEWIAKTFNVDSEKLRNRINRSKQVR
jgi:hypothetical protein